MAFVVTAFTLSQVADLEKKAAQEQEQAFLTEYRFLATRLPAILSGNTGRTTDNLSFNTTFATTVTSFRATLGAKGYDAAIHLAGNASSVPRSECMFTTAPQEACNAAGAGRVWSGTTPRGGSRPFDDTGWNAVSRACEGAALAAGQGCLPYDGTSDGLVWMCGPQVGALVGAVVHLYLTDGRSTVAETVVVALNVDWYDSEMTKAAASRCQ